MMSRFFLLVSLSILNSFTVIGQTRRGVDSRLLDSSWSSSRDLPYLESVLQAPVLTGSSVPVEISPTGQKICFDKVIKLKTATGRGIAEYCLFLNTENGLIGYYMVRPGSTGNCDIKPEDPKFNLNIIGLKGNLYTYTNNQKNGVLEHWVSTGNTNIHQYQFTQSGSSALVHKKTERRDYCSGKIKTYSYKYDGRPEEWFLFGKTFPNELRMEPKKYLGNFGVGFQNTDRGLFIIMELVSSNVDSKIIDIRDMVICFDPTPFKVFEDESLREQRQFIRKEREKLDEQAARAIGKPCSDFLMARISYQRSLLDEMENNSQASREQNAFQSSSATQKKRSDLLVNYNGVIQTSIFDTKYKICMTERRLTETQAAGGDASSYASKLNCLQQQLHEQLRVQREMEELDQQYASEPQRAFVKKSQLILQAIGKCE